jgi:hypothetical protein
MLGRLLSAVEAGAEAAEARARLAGRSVQRLLAAATGFVAAGMLMGAGLIGLLIAAHLALAPELGRAGAAAIVSAAAGGLGVIVWFVSRRLARGAPGRERPTDLELRVQAEEAAAAAHAALAGEGDEEHRGLGMGVGMDDVVRAALNNPRLVGSAGFALVSLLGPMRVLRLVARAAAAGGLLASIAEAVSDARRPGREERGGREEPGVNGHRGAGAGRARAGRR